MGGKVVNLGEQRFDRMIEGDKFYIDKTGFIREWWEFGSTVTLITRPRRFGKTLNMSMLECFFSTKYAGRGDLFEGLSIWEEEGTTGAHKYRELQVGGGPGVGGTAADVFSNYNRGGIFMRAKTLSLRARRLAVCVR